VSVGNSSRSEVLLHGDITCVPFETCSEIHHQNALPRKPIGFDVVDFVIFVTGIDVCFVAQL
jgi:hypothetical protein